MDGRRELGDFLQTRRSQLRPADVGLAGYGDRRRVPGLRREELAQLAGVSASYYARLEQGYSLNASPEVLDAIAGALRLNGVERRHLHALAAGTRSRPDTRRRPPERMTPALEELVAALGDTPALVLGRRGDVLGWNRTGHALFAGHLDPLSPGRPKDRPNMSRLVFLDPHTRELYADWPAKAKAVVGTLRVAAGLQPDDVTLANLIGELSMRSTEFAALWADHRVKSGGEPVYEMRHPLVGAMTVTQQTLHTETGAHLVVATTSPASLSLLVHTLSGTRLEATTRDTGAEVPRL